MDRSRFGSRLRVAAALVIFGTGGWVAGSAASLALGTTTLGSAEVPVSRCSGVGLSVLPVLSGGLVASVVVVLPSACGNAIIRVAVDNGTGSAIGSGTVPPAGGSVTVAVTGGPALDADVRIDTVLEGP